MKKFILLTLVAIIPFFTMAQKRGKKSKNQTTNATYDFMIITAYQVSIDQERSEGPGAVLSPDAQLKTLMKSNTKLIVEFDLGPINSPESIELNKQSRNFKSLADVVNTAASRGWNFHSATVEQVGNIKTHYYYMLRDK
tara:strand:+ start:95 stop:511 length:417 start_codon:yes stop_codon:yes gene_type:complete